MQAKHTPHAPHLNVHLDDGLADQGGPKEGPERNEEMSTCDACQVKEGIRDLGVGGGGTGGGPALVKTAD